MVRARAQSTGPEGWAWNQTTRTADMSNPRDLFNNPGPKWHLPRPGQKRPRTAVNRLIPRLDSLLTHPCMNVQVTFAGRDSVVINATLIPETRVEEEPEVVLIAEDPVPFVLNTEICPTCRSPLEFEVVTSFEDAFCVVCHTPNVQCFVACPTYNKNHGMCNDCFAVYKRNH